MASLKPLYDVELVDCARANATQGIEVAAYQCGYGNDINSFTEELKKACKKMNLKAKKLGELITDQDMILKLGSGEIIAPETSIYL
ncbi:hypothetical protein H6F32_07390 [Anabaena sp. FACHB-1237]|uniref:hypothetical protein n=1 Tax=Anabaena sp. FACHB-1237 TaxID=2692769 RepID=UPI0016801A98|nr:hypothetical protein [Anabaena sp. FACHB-1237]MBD2137411.1 hypothetical protein [Anabaena sp. FACHB-1237]